MARAKEFKHGGIKPSHRVTYRSASIESAFLPLNALVTLKSGAHIHEPIPVVRVGQEVREGQVLARAENKASAHVHSPIPGIVRRIDTILTPWGYTSTAMLVSLGGFFSSTGKRAERYIWKSLGKNDLLHSIQDKGLVALSDGSALGEYICRRGTEHSLIINALEMDPYLRVEEELLKTRPSDIIDGAAIAARITSPKRILVVIDESQTSALANALYTAAHEAEIDIELYVCKRAFPQDMPRQLADVLHIRPDSMLILEPSTLAALHDAIVLNRTHIVQHVFVGGGAIKYPTVLKARIGSQIGELIEECGGFSGRPTSIVIGDPYRGRSVASLDTSITKTTRAILALTRDEAKQAKERACTRCAECVSVCPERLNPELLIKLLRIGERQKAVEHGLYECTSCGACASVCRSRIPLVAEFDAGRTHRGQQHAAQ